MISYCNWRSFLYTHVTLFSTLNIMFFETTVTLPISRMKGLLVLLDKVQLQAKEKGIDDATLLEYRLAPDMLPFAKQIQIVSDNAK